MYWCTLRGNLIFHMHMKYKLDTLTGCCGKVKVDFNIFLRLCDATTTNYIFHGHTTHISYLSKVLTN